MPERHSPLHHRHQTAGAHLQANAVQHYGDPATEQTAIPHLALADLSPLPRSGHRGPTATTALTAQGWHPPATPNTAVPQSDGTLIAALSPTEHLLLSDWRKDTPPPLPEITGDTCHPLPRQDSHGWLLLTGRHAPATLAKLCATDLRPHIFLPGTVAQTLLAKISVIIIRPDAGAIPQYHLLADSTLLEYLWDTLLDAMTEHTGLPVGLQSLRKTLIPPE